jgi:peptide/nickel transport system substrate-binding protein
MRAAPVSLDPAELKPSDGFVAGNLCSLLYDNLVSLDEQGKPAPALATAWTSESGSQRWRFSLRRGITFQDGTVLTPVIVAASLQKADPSWKVSIAADAVIIERESPAPNLPAELALPRNAIARTDGSKVFGTGPFVVSEWDPGKKLTLVARDGYWAGRPYLDSIEIELGKNYRDQRMSFDLGRIQIAEVAPEQAHHAAGASGRVETSSPSELFALVFSHDPSGPDESKLRDALSLSIDRDLLNNVVLQGGGEPAAALLPNWMTGYEFLFPAKQNLGRAQQERAEVPQAGLWNLGFDANDPVARVVAERIVLNGRDAGLRLQFATNAPPDLQLVRLPLASLDPLVAITELTAALGLSPPQMSGNSANDLYLAENALLGERRIIPLLHLRMAVAVSTDVRGWKQDREGNWRLVDVWLGNPTP